MLIVLPGTTVMKHPRRLGRPRCFLLNFCIVLFLPALGLAQTASLRGQIVDQSGAVIPRATVSLTGPSRLERTTTTAENGFYSFQALPAGQYIV
jgi:Carboxypeptidase regulatory-like domain